jgi:hypothetical protein
MCIPNLISGQSFTKCSLILSTDVYPNIQKYIKELNINQSPNADTSKKIEDDVFDIIIKVMKDKQLIPLYPPVVYIDELKNKIRAVYFLTTVIILFDGQQSIDNVFITSILFEKRFLLYVDELKGKIGV